MGGIITLIIYVIMLFLPIILVILFYAAYRKSVKNTEERLNIEKQQTFNLQKQVDNLNERLSKIENLLKEVD